MVPPHLNFAPLDNAVDALKRSAKRYQEALAAARSDGARPSAAGLKRLNELLIRSERRLTSADGLPGRRWYRHLIYAPGEYSGYGAKTLPGVREAIELKRYDRADAEIVRAAKVLEAEAALVDEAAGMLKTSGGGAR